MNLALVGALAGAIGAEIARVTVPWPAAVRELLERIGAEEGVDPDILHAIAWQESNVNPAVARGAAGELGMMQVMPGTVPGRPGGLSFAPAELNTVPGNIRAAAQLWKAHLPIIGDSVALGFDAYNGGVDEPRRRPRVGHGNDRYVFEAMARYTAIKWSRLAPTRLVS